MLDWAHRIVYRHWQKFHGVRRLELSRLLRYLAPAAGETVLDVGSGKGALCGVLARRGVWAVGVDPSAAAVRIARRYVDPGGRFVIGSGESLPVAEGAFDKAVSVCVLEHTTDDATVLREVRRALKPGGTFALSVDCLDSPFVSSSFREHHVREYACRQLYDDGGIRRILSGAGFEILETEYLFRSRLSIAILRWGSRFHYRGPFLWLFPLVYPLLWLDDRVGGGAVSGMILTVRARRI